MYTHCIYTHTDHCILVKMIYSVTVYAAAKLCAVYHIIWGAFYFLSWTKPTLTLVRGRVVVAFIDT